MPEQGPSDEELERRATVDGDAQAMFELAERREQVSRRLLSEARELFRRSADGGSLEATHALIRLAVADGDARGAVWLLRDAKERHPDASARLLISVAPDVLGPFLRLDDDDVEGVDYPGAGTFTVVTPEARRAAVTLTPVLDRLMEVDEHGTVMSLDDREGTEHEEVYTPNYAFDMKWSEYGAEVSLDTKGVMTSPMGRVMVGMLVEALEADRIPAHIAGWLPELHTSLTVWTTVTHDDIS